MPKINYGPIALGAGLILLLAAGGVYEGTKKDGRDPLPDLELPPLPGPAEMGEVIASVCACANELAGFTGDVPAALLECVAADLFPQVPWPPVEGDNRSIGMWWEFLGAQVAAYSLDPQGYCGIEGPEPEPGPGPINFAQLVGPWISGTPTPGKFYQIVKDDKLADLARRALNSVVAGVANGDAAKDLRLDYIYCTTSGPRWNLPLYGSPKFTNTFPSYYGINGIGLRDAFMPYNEDARAKLFAGARPRRGIDQAGNNIPGTGSSFGLLWFPPVDAQTLAEYRSATCAPYNWPDGSSSIDPPSAILDLLATQASFQQG